MSSNNIVTFLIIGMAGSGKTTFAQRLVSWILSKEKNINQRINNLSIRENNIVNMIEIVNLDPAVVNTKIPPTIDIRDHFDIKEIMKKYNLGVNGAIISYLNMFLMKDISYCDKKYSVIDTPGQIEAFIWCSASEIILKSIKNPIICYIIDMNCFNMHSFMSNLIFASALHERYNVRTILVFNKSDKNNCNNIDDLLDYEYIRNITNTEDLTDIGTLSTYFEEFYKKLEKIKVSSITGEGKHAFFEQILNKL